MEPVCGKSALSDGFLELLGGAEGDLLAGLDVDRFTGGRVAAHAGGALAYLQDAEADDADALALLQMLGDPADQVVENLFSLLLGQLLVFGDRRCEMLERDGGRGRCLLRHIWPSSLLIGQEPKTYQALNDSEATCLRCFARKQHIFCIDIAKMPE